MTEKDLLDILRDKLDTEAQLYAPLRGENFGRGRRLEGETTPWEPDFTFDITWGDKTIRFVAEAKAQGTPRRVADAARYLDNLLMETGLEATPAIVVPYLSETVAEQLERFGVSGFDLNGNYMVLTPSLLAIRLDRPNEYPASRGIKKIYSYNSSIVGRFLLTGNRRYEQVNDIYQGIRDLGGGISLSTVSKVLKGLDEDLIISKTRDEIRLLQPAELLERLREGYREPRTGQPLRLNLPEVERDSILDDLIDGIWVWSGSSSAQRYTATTPQKVMTAYATPYAGSMSELRKFEDDRFYNCVVKQTNDEFVFFDRRDSWASPVESYLALSQLDKRDREIARGIRDDVILTRFNDDV